MKLEIIMRPIQEDVDLWGGFGICLTNRCNLACSYCSRDCGQGKSDSISIQKVKDLIDLFRSRGAGQKSVQFTGGEIFLYDGLDEVIEYALNEGFICQLQTNGILLPKAIARRPDLYSSRHVTIKVSVDGWNEKIHGIFRGKNTFCPIINGVKVAIAVNQSVGLKTVIHEGNIRDIRKMLDLCVALGVRSWSYNILTNSGRQASPSGLSKLGVTKKLFSLLRQRRYCHLLNGTDIQMYLLLNHLGKKGYLPFYFINCDGKVYVTDKLLSERLVGNIHDGVDSSQFDVGRVLPHIDLTLDSEVLHYICSHTEVRVERSGK